MSTPDNSASSAGANVFNVVRRVRSFDDVVLQVQNAILEGTFQTGDRLPSERDLCQMFGVGRPTLREALRVLEVLGVVDIRPGKSGGIYVARQTGEGVGVTLASLIRMAGATPEELAEFRASFEGETAGWAARRALPEEVERLCVAAATVRSIAQDPSGRWSEVVAIDINFHQTVAHASRNRVRVAVMQGLLRAVERVERGITSLAEPRLLASTADDLEAIAAAIRDKDEDRARTAMRAHVEWFSELYVRAADGRSDSGARVRRVEKCPLSPRELDILKGLATGKVYAQIARDLHLSTSTIRTHAHNAYSKLGVADRAQAVLAATARGWLDDATG